MRVEYFKVGMMETNCYFLINEETKDLAIIDPGAFDENLLLYIEKEKLRPEIILLTHGHFDHIDGVSKWQEKYPDIKVIVSEKEKELLANPNLNLSVMFLNRKVFIEEANFIKDGEEFDVIGYHVKAIWTPGHTIGGMEYYFKNEKFLFSGDSLFYHTIGRTDLPTSNNESLVSTIKEKIFNLPEDVKVFPGHGNFTNIGEEKRNNACLR